MARGAPGPHRDPRVGGVGVDLVTGYCFLFRNVVWRIGDLDPRFSPFWNEDADCYFRLKELGYDLVLAPAPVVHREHGSSRLLPDARALVERHNRLLIEKRDPRKQLVLEALRRGRGAASPSRPAGA